jgi:ribokinase
MSHSKPRLLVVGSSNTDLVIQCNRLPKPGETLLRLVDTLTPNEHEAKTVGAGARRTVVTQGARGVRIGSLLIPAPKVKPVDTVGAGDCFTAWLAVGLAEGLPLEEAARRAVRAASISVTRSGAQASMPYRQEVCELIRGCRREVD